MNGSHSVELGLMHPDIEWCPFQWWDQREQIKIVEVKTIEYMASTYIPSAPPMQKKKVLAQF